jgi:predicted DNA-binding protein
MPMSEDSKLPQTADEVGEFMDDLVFEELPTAEDEADMLASLPAGSDVMVVRSVRLPLELDQAVADAAKVAGVHKSTWVRQAIETALATQSDQDEPISRADALRALTLLRPIRHVA